MYRFRLGNNLCHQGKILHARLVRVFHWLLLENNSTRVYFTQNLLRDEQIAIGTRENKTLVVTKIIQKYPAHQ